MSKKENTVSVKYQDCILGKVGAPTERKQKALFQLIALFSSLPLTFTVNWALRAPALSWEAFVSYLYMYPLILGIVIVVRFLIANPITERITKRVIIPHCEKGLKRALLIVLLNIVFMGTIVSAIRTLLVNGGFEYFSLTSYAESLPLSFLISFCFSYFLTSPLVKKAFAKRARSSLKAQPRRNSSKSLIARGR